MTTAAANGTPAGPEPAGQLRRLAEQTRTLVGELTGPLRRVQVRHGDTVIEIEWHDRTTSVAATPSPPADASATGPTAPAADQAAPAAGHRIGSPIVGTFYRAAEPGGTPFVEVGDSIEPGQVIGIVEAMKLMNEITTDRPGVVVEILAGDGDPVEFDQPLITVAPG
ncbi:MULTISPECIES: acetyl-CoA carboxylase biotin carboxyl carrier protein [unclassified Solwaraspora]|uniref:acetyl-CoA carboxylase biotin carboxyl carrier protein n=1 Tax=unclassified Solwaraspora TaxID=2627926 RepID=UPI00248CAC7E|nr:MULTISPECIES: acetyl-CoA carboxylase biotin carboxyl carrier protein [unclassified Solwaraspora]WBB95950.1 acetyl-CoA carboxylase biotin carboxyl carrier protein [Solwaraspora sp. WMMA2059]WBC20145.1 acetyl-CoA carboxylase biotin carboxyl carrier protein [Solwaraspora sp. WMMA2080]WJK32268.1 acetyl-CoA carboxylase biotin carboxyl carrier protein [Solwaraspora sp. WMMA2065]